MSFDTGGIITNFNILYCLTPHLFCHHRKGENFRSCPLIEIFLHTKYRISDLEQDMQGAQF